MRELDKTLTKYQCEFKQMSSTVLGYVYRKTCSSGLVTYEVFKRLENKKYKCISFPSDKAFGVWAWAYHNLDTAINKLNSFKPVKNK